MSDNQVMVNKFIHLLLTQPCLFSEEDRTKLDQLINSVSDDIETLSNSIADWCLERPKVANALGKLENNVRQRAPGTEKANPNIPKYPTDKKTLLNAIQQSSSPPKKGEK
jgi:hypothetical protein